MNTTGVDSPWADLFALVRRGKGGPVVAGDASPRPRVLGWTVRVQASSIPPPALMSSRRCHTRNPFESFAILVIHE